MSHVKVRLSTGALNISHSVYLIELNNLVIENACSRPKCMFYSSAAHDPATESRMKQIYDLSSVAEKLSWLITHLSDGLYIFYSNLWNLSSDIWAKPSEMSDDFVNSS